MKNDGGPAFPAQAIAYPSGAGVVVAGMSLRDYFAGQVLSGMAARDSFDEGQATPAQRARLAYIDADAMLAERAKDGA